MSDYRKEAQILRSAFSETYYPLVPEEDRFGLIRRLNYENYYLDYQQGQRENSFLNKVEVLFLSCPPEEIGIARDLAYAVAKEFGCEKLHPSIKTSYELITKKHFINDAGLIEYTNETDERFLPKNEKEKKEIMVINGRDYGIILAARERELREAGLIDSSDSYFFRRESKNSPANTPIIKKQTITTSKAIAFGRKIVNNDWFKLIATGLIVLVVGTLLLVYFKIIH